MSRRLRYVPEGGALVEVTTRTQDARFLLRPDDPLNAIVVGVLARALPAPSSLPRLALARGT